MVMGGCCGLCKRSDSDESEEDERQPLLSQQPPPFPMDEAQVQLSVQQPTQAIVNPGEETQVQLMLDDIMRNIVSRFVDAGGTELNPGDPQEMLQRRLYYQNFIETAPVQISTLQCFPLLPTTNEFDSHRLIVKPLDRNSIDAFRKMAKVNAKLVQAIRINDDESQDIIVPFN